MGEIFYVEMFETGAVLDLTPPLVDRNCLSCDAIVEVYDLPDASMDCACGRIAYADMRQHSRLRGLLDTDRGILRLPRGMGGTLK